MLGVIQRLGLYQNVSSVSFGHHNDAVLVRDDDVSGLDLTSIALAKSPKLDNFKGFVDDSGEGRWTINAAIEEAVPVNVLSAALYARFRSRVENSFGDKLLSAMRNEFGGHVEGALEKGMAPKPKT